MKHPSRGDQADAVDLIRFVGRYGQRTATKSIVFAPAAGPEFAPTLWSIGINTQHRRAFLARR